MADITNEKKQRIVFLLGYPVKVLVPDSTHFNRIIRDRMNNLEDYTVTQVDDILTLIESTRTKLDETRDDSQVNRVGEIGLDPAYADKYISKQYMRYLKELSSILDIPIRKHTSGSGSISVKW